MVNGDVMCERCGWRNAAPARVCGGCGQPLRQVNVPGYGAAGGGGSALAGTYAADAATLYQPQIPAAGASMPMAGYSGPDTQPDYARPAWPRGTAGEVAEPPRRPRSGPRRLLSAVMILAVVAGVLLGAWVVAIRPAIHGAVDGRIRSVLNSGVDQVPNVPFLALVGPVNVHLSASDVNDMLARELPADSPVSDPHVRFANGQVVVTFTAAGQQGQVTTRLVDVDGRLKAENTQVSCPLCVVESDTEMQSAINDSLSQLPSSYNVTQFSVGQDEINLTVAGR